MAVEIVHFGFKGELVESLDSDEGIWGREKILW